MKQERIDFIKERGFKNVSEFARAVKEDATNTHKVINGTQKPSVEKLFKYANVLECSMEQILNLFYPKEMKEHIRLTNQKELIVYFKEVQL